MHALSATETAHRHLRICTFARARAPTRLKCTPATLTQTHTQNHARTHAHTHAHAHGPVGSVCPDARRTPRNGTWPRDAARLARPAWDAARPRALAEARDAGVEARSRRPLLGGADRYPMQVVGGRALHGDGDVRAHREHQRRPPVARHCPLVCVRMRVRACACVCVCVCVCARARVRARVCARTCECARLCLCVRLCACFHPCACACVLRASATIGSDRGGQAGWCPGHPVYSAHERHGPRV